MNVEKPDNPLRKTLALLGVLIYRLKLAKLVIRLSPNRVRTLLYHAVDDQPNPYTDGLSVSVSPKTFAANLDYFASHYNVIPVSAVEEGTLPRSPLLITFDDGYTSVHQHAVPELQKRSLPACVYLIGRAVQGELVWVNLLNYALNEHAKTTRDALSSFPDLASLKRREDIIAQIQHFYTPSEIESVCKTVYAAIDVPEEHHLYSNPEQIVAMQEAGIDFGFHTQDHYNLGLCNEQELKAQFNRESIDSILSSNTFAYPFGLFSTQAMKEAEKHQYGRLMTVGNNNNLLSPLHLDRTEVFTAEAASVFAQLEVVEPMIAWLRRIFRSSTISPAVASDFDVEKKAV
ncbi:MAG: polysaccharide deacetylase family protein [Gammaproteobacteria bacterium]|nr:polysaccharide deacetylase family protein [Gammaproteobacteria bacterium]